MSQDHVCCIYMYIWIQEYDINNNLCLLASTSIIKRINNSINYWQPFKKKGIFTLNSLAVFVELAVLGTSLVSMEKLVWHGWLSTTVCKLCAETWEKVITGELHVKSSAFAPGVHLKEKCESYVRGLWSKTSCCSKGWQNVGEVWWIS